MASSGGGGATAASLTPCLAVGLVLAEFDVDKGPCVRACYPRAAPAAGAATTKAAASARNSNIVVGSPTSPAATTSTTALSSAAVLSAAMAAHAEAFASDMLPDGAERQRVARTVLVVNRPQPPLYTRLPAYYFVPAADTRDSSGDGGASDASSWRRYCARRNGEMSQQQQQQQQAASRAGDDVVGVLSSHIVLVDKATGALTIRGAEAGVLLDAVPVALDAIDVLTTLPHEAEQLARQLSTRMLGSHLVARGDNDDDARASTSVAVTRSHDQGATQQQLPLLGYVFVVLHTHAGRVGLLMQLLHYHALLQALNDALQPTPPTSAIVADGNAHEGSRAVDTRTATTTTTTTTTTTMTTTTRGTSSGPVLYGLCAVVTKHDRAARRGGVTKSVAAVGPALAWLEPFFATLVDAAQYCCDIPGHDDDAVQQQTHVLRRCYESINRAAALVASASTGSNNNNHNSSDNNNNTSSSPSLPPLTRLRMDVYGYSTRNTPPRAYVTYRDAPFGTTRKATLAVLPSLHDVTWTRYSLEHLLDVLGPSFMQLVVGVLTQQRILVLSRQGCATDVCEAALALGLLASVVDANALPRRVFPCVALHHAEAFVRVPGYIVGTVNPIFANDRVWRWDLLCDLDACTVVAAPRRAIGKKTPSLARTLATAASSGLASAMSAVAAAVDVGNNNSSNTSTTPSASGTTPVAAAAAAAAAGNGGTTAVTTATASAQSVPSTTTTSVVDNNNSSNSSNGKDVTTGQTLQQLYQSLVQRMYRMRALRVPLPERVHVLRLCLAEYMHVLLLLGVAVSRGLIDWHVRDDNNDNNNDNDNNDNNDKTCTSVHDARVRDGDVIDGRLLTPLRDTFCSATAVMLRLQCQVTSIMDHIDDGVLHSPREPVALPLYVAALRRCHTLSRDYDYDDATTRLLQLLHTLHRMLTTDERVLLLLRRMPCALSGLEPVAMQLTHPDAAVRAAALALLERVEQVHEGQLAIGAMRSYLVLVYEDEVKAARARRERQRRRALPLMQQAE